MGAIALGGSPQSGIIASPMFAGVVSVRHCVAPPPFGSSLYTVYQDLQPLIYTMVHYFTLYHINKGYRDKTHLLRYNGAIELLTSSVSFCRGDLLRNSDSYSGGVIIPHHGKGHI